MDFIDPPATKECPDMTECKNCGRQIWWDEYGYTHATGWADCSTGDTFAYPVTL